MKRTLTTIRCVPRLGLPHTQLRVIDLDVVDADDLQELLAAANTWFALRGIQDAVYDVDVDNEGPLVVVNDEAFASDWGELLR